MSSSLKRITGSPLLRFGVVGLVSTALDIAVYNLCLRLGISVYIAGALGFFTGFSNGYFFNSRFVFAGASRSRYIKYFTVSIGGLIITELVLRLFHGELNWSANEAKLTAVVIVFCWNYLLSSRWAFR